ARRRAVAAVGVLEALARAAGGAPRAQASRSRVGSRVDGRGIGRAPAGEDDAAGRDADHRRRRLDVAGQRARGRRRRARARVGARLRARAVRRADGVRGGARGAAAQPSSLDRLRRSRVDPLRGAQDDLRRRRRDLRGRERRRVRFRTAPLRDENGRTNEMTPHGRPKVLIYRPVDESGESHRRLADAGCTVVAEELDLDRARLLAAAPDAAALVGATFRGGLIDREILESFPELRIVAKYTIGIDDVDLDAATALGILVTHCPTEANWGGVAEGTIALMLACLKRVGPRDRHVKAGGWRDKGLEGVYVGRRADGYPGLTIGIIGLGRAGSRVAR